MAHKVKDYCDKVNENTSWDEFVNWYFSHFTSFVGFLRDGYGKLS